LSGFSHNINVNTSYSLNIRRIDDINRFFYVIGTSNPKHKTKYEVWKKIGYLPPYTTIKDRKIILNQKN